MIPPNERVEYKTQLLQRLSELKAAIEQTAVGPDDEWFRGLLLGILASTAMDIETVDDGLRRQSVSQMAWGKRNLLELRLITFHILSAESNAREYQIRVVHDTWQFYEAVVKLERVLDAQVEAALTEEVNLPGPMQEIWRRALHEHKQALPPKEAIAEAAAHKQVLEELGMLSAHFTRPKEMAAKQSAAAIEELEAMNKVCSLVLHRTALSIAAARDTNSLTELKSMLNDSSVYDVLVIYDAINTHFKQKGLRPKNR